MGKGGRNIFYDRVKFQISLIGVQEMYVLNISVFRSDVAHQLGSKTHTECERHYNSCYIDNPSQGLPGTYRATCTI